MKSLKFTLAGLLLFLATTVAQAQFITGIKSYSCVINTGTNAYTVAASATTNVPTTDAIPIVLGGNGVAIGVFSCAAGSSLATNTLVFESSLDGVNWINNLPLLNVYVTNCTTVPIVFATNFATTLPQIANVSAIRLKYITNSSAQITYYSNIVAAVR